MQVESKTTNNSAKLASIYARTSSPNQRDNYSIDEQISQCQKYCEQRGWQIKYVFVDESQSGKSIEGRPKFQLMMQRAKAREFGVIIVWKLDRFARSLVDLVNVERTLRGYDIELCSVTEFVDTTTSVGRFNYRSLASVAELERELIGERARMGLYALAREGRWPNAHPALGYDRDADGRLNVNEKEAMLVIEIFQQYIKQKSMPAVAFWLNRIGAATKKGARGIWSVSTVKNILCNNIYIGQYRVAGHVETVDSLKIVDEKVFHKAKRIMKRYQEQGNSKKSRRLPMPLGQKQAGLQKMLTRYQEFLVQTVT